MAKFLHIVAVAGGDGMTHPASHMVVSKISMRLKHSIFYFILCIILLNHLFFTTQMQCEDGLNTMCYYDF